MLTSSDFQRLEPMHQEFEFFRDNVQEGQYLSPEMPKTELLRNNFAELEEEEEEEAISAVNESRFQGEKLGGGWGAVCGSSRWRGAPWRPSADSVQLVPCYMVARGQILSQKRKGRGQNSSEPDPIFRDVKENASRATEELELWPHADCSELWPHADCSELWPHADCSELWPDCPETATFSARAEPRGDRGIRRAGGSLEWIGDSAGVRPATQARNSGNVVV
jgi:hypothetical protein